MAKRLSMEKVLVVAASAVLLAHFVQILYDRGGPYFGQPATIVEHLGVRRHNTRTALLLIPKVRPLLPVGAQVTCFHPVDGKWTYDIAAFHTAAALLPQQKVLPPFSAAENLPKDSYVEYVIALEGWFTNPAYRSIADFPEGRLYQVQR